MAVRPSLAELIGAILETFFYGVSMSAIHLGSTRILTCVGIYAILFSLSLYLVRIRSTILLYVHVSLSPFLSLLLYTHTYLYDARTHADRTFVSVRAYTIHTVYICMHTMQIVDLWSACG